MDWTGLGLWHHRLLSVGIIAGDVVESTFTILQFNSLKCRAAGILGTWKRSGAVTVWSVERLVYYVPAVFSLPPFRLYVLLCDSLWARPFLISGLARLAQCIPKWGHCVAAFSLLLPPGFPLAGTLKRRIHKGGRSCKKSRGTSQMLHLGRNIMNFALTTGGTTDDRGLCGLACFAAPAFGLATSEAAQGFSLIREGRQIFVSRHRAPSALRVWSRGRTKSNSRHAVEFFWSTLATKPFEGHGGSTSVLPKQ